LEICGNSILDPTEECDDGNLRSGDGCSAFCKIEHLGGQGCSPGFWKHGDHFRSWKQFSPSQNYGTVFGVRPSFTKTLLGALQQGGGGEKALGRQAVAALLNAANARVNYAFTVQQVIAKVQQAYARRNFEAIKNELERENDRACPLSGHEDDEEEDDDDDHH
jgi:cysteine-rich repeat protein